MKKENVLAVGLIGVIFAGLILTAFGNPLGAFLVAGVIMIGAGL